MWASSKKKKSQKQESKVAKELSGKTVVASGALWGSKGDVKTEYFLVECKTTAKDSYRLTHAVWKKILHEAVKDGMRFPLMCIDLYDGKERYAVFQANLFHGIDGVPKPSYNYTAVNSILVSSKLADSRITCHLSLEKPGETTLNICVAPWDNFIEWSDYLICQL